MKKIGLLICLIFTGCVNQQQNNLITEQPISEKEQLLLKGISLLGRNRTKEAVTKYFDKIIQQCQGFYNNPEQQVYAARDLTETLYYMMQARNENKDAIVIDYLCAEAIYYKGYASFDLGELENAKKYLQQALALSPVNSQYRSELGHYYQIKRDWKNALATFQQAEKDAEISPATVKNKELTRAKRGVGYILIELGQFEEAKQKYHECLKINPQDKTAQDELFYIEQQILKLKTK